MTPHIRTRPANTTGHLEALRRRHRELDARVETESRRVHQDTVLLMRLKRERLRLRDELARYETLLRTPATSAA